jgi:hypothetical protein
LYRRQEQNEESRRALAGLRASLSPVAPPQPSPCTAAEKLALVDAMIERASGCPDMLANFQRERALLLEEAAQQEAISDGYGG